MAKSVTKKLWTVMAYMAGDNNLDPEGVTDLKEMKEVGSTDNLNIVAQFDRATGHVAQRYYVRKGGTIANDAVISLGKVNTGDPKRLYEFIQWAVTNYPADHYLLDLWNHGQGWNDTDIYAGERFRSLRRLAAGPIRHALFHTPVRKTLEDAKSDAVCRAILLDDDAKDFLDNKELKKVLADAAKLIGKKVDILGMDACLMSMAEVGYQICEIADFMVSSEQTEPGAGWPYATILGPLAKNPSMTPRDFSSLIVTQYLASYKSTDDVTYSACDLSQAEALITAITGLAKVLKASLSDSAARQRLLTVHSKVQTYAVPDNIDLVDFCSLLMNAGPSQEIASACRNVKAAVQTSYVFKQGYKGKNVRNSNGLAIYFPTKIVSPLYAGLDFRITGWDSFLKAFVEAVRSRN
jgi:hypothetical protein